MTTPGNAATVGSVTPRPQQHDSDNPGLVQGEISQSSAVGANTASGGGEKEIIREIVVQRVVSSTEMANRAEEQVQLGPSGAIERMVIITHGADIPTIADRGTAADIISLREARTLVQEGIVDRIYPPSRPAVVQFGITSARAEVVGEIRGRGLLGIILVVDSDLPLVLISDITFTSKGVILIQDDFCLLGVAGNKKIFEGTRDPSAPRHEASAMWRLDLRQLLLEPDPRLNMASAREVAIKSAQDVLDLWQRHSAATREQAENIISCGARPTYTVKDVRMGRSAIRNFGCMPAFTLASTIERNALRDIQPQATPALFRALGNARGNIPQHLATARKSLTGGTGIHSTQTGNTVSMDDLGKYPASIFGITNAAVFRDEACKYVAPYGLLAKTDMLDALRKYCQFVEACGKGPVRFARCDATSLVSKVDGSWTAAFAEAAAELQLHILPSAPEDQQTNPVERSWQTVSHRMCAMMLNQDNLAKNMWFLFLLAACAYENAVCHGDEMATPLELMCGWKPDYNHFTEFYTGQLAMCPRVGGKQFMQSAFQLCVTVCPVPYNKANLVLLEDSRQLQVRVGVKPVGTELHDLSEAEAAKLQPTFQGNKLIAFHSRATNNFSLQAKMRAYHAGEDLLRAASAEEGEDGGPTTTDKKELLEEERMTKPVRTPKEPPMTLRGKRTRESEGPHSDEPMGPQALLHPGSKQALFPTKAGQQAPGAHQHAAQPTKPPQYWQEEQERAIADHLLDHVLEHERVPEEIVVMLDDVEDRGEETIVALKARIVHTKDNPTPGMLERDPALAEIWRPCTIKEISGSIEKGYRMIITPQQVRDEGWRLYPLVTNYTTKRDQRRKCRATTDGSVESAASFDRNALFAQAVPIKVLKFLTAFAAYHGMADEQADVTECFSAHNLWTRATRLRHICHHLTAYQSPTGLPEIVADLTNNYGTRDGPGQWCRYRDKTLIELCSLTQSRVFPQVFYRLREEAGLLIVGVTMDDLRILSTRNPDGIAMKEEMIKVLVEDEKWELTRNVPTKDYASIEHSFEEHEGRNTVTLTQPSQIHKAAAHFFGEDLTQVPEVYVPFAPEWSLQATLQCPTTVPVETFMRAQGMLAWTGQTRMESPLIPLMACRGLKPTTLDLDNLKNYAAFLYTTREVGITFYEGPKDRDIRQPIPFHAAADAGENSHIDGAAHMGMVFKMGEPGHPGGAFHTVSQKAPGAVGGSTPVDECLTLKHACAETMIFRHLAEELAGLTSSISDPAELTSIGSAGPTPCTVGTAAYDALTRSEEGLFGNAGAQTAATILTQPRKQTTPQRHAPTQIAQDNAGVVDTVNNICVNHKALLGLSRMVNHLRGLVAAKVVQPIKVPAEKMTADGLTKIIASPTLFWNKAAAPILGAHPSLTAIQHKVALKFNKRLTVSERHELGTPAMDNGAPLMAMAAVGPCTEEPPWLGRTRQGIRSMLQHKGFTQCPPSPTRPETERQPAQKTHKRVTFMAAAAAEVTESAQEEEEVCLPERLRRALMKLTAEERMMFSTRWRGVGLGDMITQAMSAPPAQRTDPVPSAAAAAAAAAAAPRARTIEDFWVSMAPAAHTAAPPPPPQPNPTTTQASAQPQTAKGRYRGSARMQRDKEFRQRQKIQNKNNK
jgi:hypothetical protein